MAPGADATAGASQGWHDLEAVLAEEPAATLLAAYLGDPGLVWLAVLPAPQRTKGGAGPDPARPFRGWARPALYPPSGARPGVARGARHHPPATPIGQGRRATPCPYCAAAPAFPRRGRSSHPS